MDPEVLDGVDPVPHGGITDPDVLDFSANTNPRTPSGVGDVYRAALESARRYPGDSYPDFRAAVARVVGCDPDAVVPTPGGLGAIRLAVGSAISTGDTALVPAPSFGEYAREVRLQGGRPVFVDHDCLLASDPDGYALAVVCTPNNPTGEAADPSTLRDFAARCREGDTTLLVDEAFLDYTDNPSMAGQQGVVVARSLTKLYGLPGLRMGYAVATGDLLDRLAAARQPWALSAPAAAVGTHCLGQREFVRETRRRVRTERQRLRAALEPRYEVAPSDAPFLLLDVGEEDPEAVCDRAEQAGVVIRDATTFRRLDNHVRVAVKDPAANDELLEALDG